MVAGGLADELTAQLPELRGKLKAGAVLADLTWFRVGGPAEILYSPADEADLSYFMANTPAEIPVTIIGLGSNLLVRDGGIGGVVIRLGRGFGDINIEDGFAAPRRRRRARREGRPRRSRCRHCRPLLLSRHPRLRRRRAAHEWRRPWTRDLRGCGRGPRRRPPGNVHVLPVAELHYAYRHCGAPEDLIFTEALFQGEPGEPAAILAEMDDIAAYREQAQPIKSRTGGSTFKNPPGNKAWQLIDAAGCRGLRVGGAHVSEMHCNFLINEGEATGADIEELGETVRARVKAKSGVELEWEIKRLGVPR